MNVGSTYTCFSVSIFYGKVRRWDSEDICAFGSSQTRLLVHVEMAPRIRRRLCLPGGVLLVLAASLFFSVAWISYSYRTHGYDTGRNIMVYNADEVYKALGTRSGAGSQ